MTEAALRAVGHEIIDFLPKEVNEMKEIIQKCDLRTAAKSFSEILMHLVSRYIRILRTGWAKAGIQSRKLCLRRGRTSKDVQTLLLSGYADGYADG
jgi:hypothetical protein